MTFTVRLTEHAEADLVRLYEFALSSSDGNWAFAERALHAIRHGIHSLETSPFSYRKAMADNPFMRELIIPFGAAGYVALFEIDSQDTVTVLALRHQREDDYR